MTLREFYRELRKCRKDYTWEINGIIRGYKNNTRYCPITAVTLYKTQVFYSTERFDSAGKKLGLTYKQISKIVNSADSKHYKYPNNTVRQQLLKAIQEV